MAAIRCTHCRRFLAIDFTTDLRGHVHEAVEFCGCPGSRKQAGICKYCMSPVDSKRSSYCGDEHRKRGARASSAAYRNTEKGRLRAQRDNARRREPEQRAKLREQERARRSTPENRARRKVMRRRTYLKNHDRYLEHRRLYRERHPERVKEQTRKQNERRAKEKREYMHRYATKYVGPGKSPKCRDCSADIPFSGRGRPHVRCESCDPKSWRRDQRRAA